MTFADDIHSTQKFAKAAEAFVDVLRMTFSEQRFEEFFDSGALMRAYWNALQRAIKRFSIPGRAPIVAVLLEGEVFADHVVVTELLRMFVPGQLPDYLAVARAWEMALDMDGVGAESLVLETETLLSLLADEVRQTPALRVALQQLVQAHEDPLPHWDKDITTAEQDLNRLLDTALISGPVTLSLQVRNLMALASDRAPLPTDTPGLTIAALARLADRLPADELRLLWEQLDRIADPVLHVRVLAQIAPYLSRLNIVTDPLALVRDALEDGTERIAPALRAEILLDLAPHLDATNRDSMPNFQQRVLTGVQSISDPASRVRALGAVIPYLPAQFQSQATLMAFDAVGEGIASESARAEALSVLVPHLPPEFQERLLGLAYELGTPEARALLLGRMIPQLRHALRTQALIGALNAIEQIPGDEARMRALMLLAPSLDAVGPLQYLPEGLRQALEVTFSIEYQGDRARAFAALAPYLSPELMDEALELTRNIVDDHDRAATLTRLVPHLTPELQVVAFNIARELRPAYARATALVVIAPFLALAARQQALYDAFAATVAIPERYDRVVMLADLAPHLVEDLQHRALTEALKATRSIPDHGERARALVFLVPHLLEEQVPEAMTDAYTILDPLERTPVVSALLTRLPQEPRLHISEDTLKAARRAGPPHHKASILAAIAPVLPGELVPEAVRIAEAIDTPFDRVHALTALLPHNPEGLHDMALEAAYEVPNRYQRVNALLELIPHTSFALRYPILTEALDTALGVQDDHDRASALSHLAPYIDQQADVQNQQQDALHMALHACLEIADPGVRAAQLARLARVWSTLLMPAQSYTLWRDVVEALRTRPQAETISDLAALAPVIVQMGMPRAVDAVAEKLGAALFTMQQ